jgi:hypothetical protein
MFREIFFSILISPFRFRFASYRYTTIELISCLFLVTVASPWQFRSLGIEMWIYKVFAIGGGVTVAAGKMD